MAFLPLLLAFLVLSSSSSSAASFRAEDLIHSLNLFPQDAVPQSMTLNYTTGKRIVETSFKFPGLVDTAAGAGPSVDDLGHHAGYYSIAHSHAARMFYFFFESRTDRTDPVVLWLTGGPGCSSDVALFYENGPFKIGDDMSLTWNDYGWDQISNLIYVDQPTGTGFSYSSDERDLRHDENGISNDMYDFLQAFFAEHPQYTQNDFYITGESYAGHYIPALAGRVHPANKAKEGMHINLKGFAIGNGLTVPAIQYKAYADYALQMKIISQSDYSDISQLYPHCDQATNDCDTSGGDLCRKARDVCNEIFSEIMTVAGDMNYYDIRKKCVGDLCYDFSNMEEFMNTESVRKALKVGDIKFVSCSPRVYDAMVDDWMRDLEMGIPALIEDGINLLVYAGEYDLICNWLGNSRWVHSMSWSGQKDFGASPAKPFIVDGKEAGLLQAYGPLNFLKVHDAGHMVPMDQPKAALEMLRRWIQGSLVEFPFKPVDGVVIV